MVGVRTREPPHFFLLQFRKNGYPSLAADYTLALSSLMAAVVGLHEKRPALPEKWKNRSRLGQCAGADWDTFDAAKLMIFSETVAF